MAFVNVPGFAILVYFSQPFSECTKREAWVKGDRKRRGRSGIKNLGELKATGSGEGKKFGGFILQLSVLLMWCFWVDWK